MLIASIPGTHCWEKISEILGNQEISEVRYNTGIESPDSVLVTLNKLNQFLREKVLWLDLKWRQLRVSEWCTPDYAMVDLNYPIKVSLPARICFRGVGWSEIALVRGERIFLKEPPKQALGRGQAVNIQSDFLEIYGYEENQRDRSYVEDSEGYGFNHFMISFFEGFEDLEKLRMIFGEERAKKVFLGLKIESEKGVRFVEGLTRESFSSIQDSWAGVCLVVARDDLMVSLKNPAKILSVQKRCIEIDSEAILASQIFVGAKSEEVFASNFTDLEFLRGQGYSRFMLSDGICFRNFSRAIELWRQYNDIGE